MVHVDPRTSISWSVSESELFTDFFRGNFIWNLSTGIYVKLNCDWIWMKWISDLERGRFAVEDEYDGAVCPGQRREVTAKSNIWTFHGRNGWIR